PEAAAALPNAQGNQEPKAQQPNAQPKTQPNAQPANPAASQAPEQAAQAKAQGEAEPDVLFAKMKAALEPHGTWSEHPIYGTIWVPNRAKEKQGFTPYLSNGRWALADNGDWLW